jgi:mRNA-degrading endonuclease toxin of MazEF toxin-antitoxin module
MIDKIVSVPRAAIAREVGECDTAEIAAVDDGLRRWLGLE